MGWYSSSGQWHVLRANARRMRKNPTPAEARLWEYLRGQRLLGINFRRQHAIGRWIVDFCAPVPRLIIELDGGIHRERQTEDAERQGNLEAGGFHVLRFPNEAVLTDMERVLETIRNEVMRLGTTRKREN